MYCLLFLPFIPFSSSLISFTYLSVCLHICAQEHGPYVLLLCLWTLFLHLHDLRAPAIVSIRRLPFSWSWWSSSRALGTVYIHATQCSLYMYIIMLAVLCYGNKFVSSSAFQWLWESVTTGPNNAPFFSVSVPTRYSPVSTTALVRI